MGDVQRQAGGVAAVAQHPHAETVVRYLGQPGADRTDADDAERLAGQLGGGAGPGASGIPPRRQQLGVHRLRMPGDG